MNYNIIIDIEKIKEVYHIIKINTKNKNKIIKFELFFISNIMEIYNELKNKTYKHENYNIFLIKENKYRIIMSEKMKDKIVNHLLSKYILFPIIEPHLISANVATRKNMGSSKAINDIKKYINKLKDKHEKIYILKCDIHKYFYSIDHKILKKKIKKYITDENILEIIDNILDSTNEKNINNRILKEIEKEKTYIESLKISKKEKQIKKEELDRIPLYNYDLGLPIGNMTSQIFAIFYLNDLDHYIKEKLHVKYYERYMDDFILIHHDKEYLKYCLKKIEIQIKNLNLKLNDKTQIYELHNGLPFLGYKFILKGKKLHILLSNNCKKRIKKRYKSEKNINIQKIYNGHLINTDSKNFIHSLNSKNKT